MHGAGHYRGHYVLPWSPSGNNLLWQWQAVCSLHTTVQSSYRKVSRKESCWQLSILKVSLCAPFCPPLAKLLDRLPLLTWIWQTTPGHSPTPPQLQIGRALLVKSPHAISQVHSCDLLSHRDYSSFVRWTRTLTHPLRFRINLCLLQPLALAASRLLFALLWLALRGSLHSPSLLAALLWQCIFSLSLLWQRSRYRLCVHQCTPPAKAGQGRERVLINSCWTEAYHTWQPQGEIRQFRVGCWTLSSLSSYFMQVASSLWTSVSIIIRWI